MPSLEHFNPPDSGASARTTIGATIGTDGQPSAYRMRCPHCQKLYTVSGATMRSAAGALKFQCVGCQAPFAARLSVEDHTIQTFDLEIPVHKPRPARPEPAAVVEVPQKVSSNSELSCPKCGVRNALSATECKTCGVVFAKAKTEADLNAEIAFGGKRELAELWTQVISDYENQGLHERFIRACYEAESLPFASQKYGRILSASPSEETATSMSKRIVALAGYRMEKSPRSEVPTFRLPAINNLLLLFGSMVMVIGLLTPGLKSVSGVGLAAVLLGAGVHFFLRPQR